MKKINIIAILIGMVIFSNVFVYADEVTDVINEALQQYQNKEYAAASGSLEYAAQLVRQKKGELLKALLPEPLDKWTAEEASTQSSGAALFGGGTSVKRDYRKDSANVTIQFIVDSPFIQSMSMLFTNPVMATSDGSKLEKIGKEKALVRYKENNQRGEVRILVANRVGVILEGIGISRDDLLAYAKEINYEKLAELP